MARARRAVGLLFAAVLCLGNSDCLGVGRENAITLGADGLALISYEDGVNSDLKVAHCEDAGCTRATLSVVDSEGVVGGYSALVRGSDGLGLIAYAGAGLRVAHCQDAACTRAKLSVVDPATPGAAHISVAVGRDGLPLISYRNRWSGPLKVAHCEDKSCSRARLTTLVEDACCVGRNSAIAIGRDGLGLAAYYDDREGMSVAHCQDLACTSASFATLESKATRVFVDGRFGLAIGADGLGLISYQNNVGGGLNVAHCQDAACWAADAISNHRTGDIGDGHDSSIAIGRDGLPLIASRDLLGTLAVTHCADVACRSALTSVVGEDAYYTSLTIGADGLGLVGYWDTQLQVLKAAHCQDAACTRAVVTTVDAGGA